MLNKIQKNIQGLLNTRQAQSFDGLGLLCIEDYKRDEQSYLRLINDIKENIKRYEKRIELIELRIVSQASLHTFCMIMLSACHEKVMISFLIKMNWQGVVHVSTE